MREPTRTGRTTSVSILILAFLAVGVAGGSFQAAVQNDGQGPEQAAAGGAEGQRSAAEESEAESRRVQKERAKEARINEYLRKKEERRAMREMRRREKETQAQAAATVESSAAAGGIPVDAGRAGGEPPPVAKKRKKRARADRGPAEPEIPRNLQQIHESLRLRDIGQDPTVQAYMELIERAEASPHQLAAFGNFLGQFGMNREALEYYAVALSLERDDPVLWMNVGTLHRQLGEYGQAQSAYGRAIAIDPNNAFAHYNLGAVLDENGNYKDSIDEYRLALTLDPTLGDPVYNPQAANNERLLAVKLMLYKEQTGSIGLPLADVPKGRLDAEDSNP